MLVPPVPYVCMQTFRRALFRKFILHMVNYYPSHRFQFVTGTCGCRLSVVGMLVLSGFGLTSASKYTSQLEYLEYVYVYGMHVYVCIVCIVCMYAVALWNVFGIHFYCHTVHAQSVK